MTDQDTEHGDDTIEPTGVAAADDAAEQLHALDDAPLADHVGIYEDVHLRLQDALADLDDRAP